MEVRRVPEFKEEGSAKAYYNRPPMDNSRGGIFYANLRKVHEHPKYTMKTLAYHEGIPGHHFQIAIQAELEGVPIFRTAVPFTAYAEGWALYTEQLAWELGFYDNDPFGNLGRLQAEIWRAVRLVVDTGLHEPLILSNRIIILELLFNLNPPSISISAPVINPVCSEHKKATK